MTAPYVAHSEPGVKRPNYFSGKLLTAEDLAEEQNYRTEKHRQLTRAILGWGVVRGLGLTCEGDRVRVEPGFAVDSLGRLVEVRRPCEFRLPACQGIWEVEVELAEEPCDPLPRETGEPDDAWEPEGGDEPSADSTPVSARIQEVVKVWLVDRTADAAAPRDDRRVPIGRIRAWDGRTEVGAARRDVKSEGGREAAT